MKLYKILSLPNHISSKDDEPILKQPLLYLEDSEKKDLLEKWEETQDPKARSLLFQSQTYYSIRVALSYSQKYNIPFADLFQEAMLGLSEAFARFSEKRLGLNFDSYVHIWMNHQIRTFIYQNSSIVPYKKDEAKKLFFKISPLYQKLSGLSESLKPFLSTEQITENIKDAISQTQELGYLLASLSESLDLNHVAISQNHSEETNRQSSPQLAECVPSRERNAEMKLCDQQRQQLLRKHFKKAMAECSPREADILAERCFKQTSLQTLGTKFAITKERTRQLETKALKQIHQYFLNLDTETLKDLEIPNDGLADQFLKKNQKLKPSKTKRKYLHSGIPYLPADSPFLSEYAPFWVHKHLEEKHQEDRQDTELCRGRMVCFSEQKRSAPFLADSKLKSVSPVIRQDISSKSLQEVAQKEADSDVKRRFIGIIALLEGKTHQQAASLAGVNYLTIYKWAKRYNAEGISGLYTQDSRSRQKSIKNYLIQKKATPAGLYTLISQTKHQKLPLQVFASVLEGYSTSQVVKKHNVSERRIYGWIDIFKNEGIDGFLKKELKPKPTTERDLNSEDLRNLASIELSSFVKARILGLAYLLEEKPIPKEMQKTKGFESWIKRFNLYGIWGLFGARFCRFLSAPAIEKHLANLRISIKDEKNPKRKQRLLAIATIFEDSDWPTALKMASIDLPTLYLECKDYIRLNSGNLTQNP